MKNREGIEAAKKLIQAKLDQADADRQEEERKSKEDLLGSLLPVTDPNVIGRNLQNMEQFLILGVSIFE